MHNIQWVHVLIVYFMCRREALSVWKSNDWLNATYRCLLKLFVDAKHSKGATAVCNVLRKKG